MWTNLPVLRSNIGVAGPWLRVQADQARGPHGDALLGGFLLGVGAKPSRDQPLWNCRGQGRRCVAWHGCGRGSFRGIVR